MVGEILGHYRVLEKLGEGGMGVVWKALDTRLDRLVALKTLSAETLADAERNRRFVQEARSASALNHPNIVHIYDIATENGTQFIAMEYVPGKTLDHLIGRKGLPTKQLLEYAVQITDALAKAHSAGIVHCDLKPGNIMVTESGLVKLVDFGLAKLVDPGFAAASSIHTKTLQSHPSDTAGGRMSGTLPYMSPEQAEGKKVDARTDVFSFGAVLYEMVTGHRAFRGDSPVSTLSAILKDEPNPCDANVPRDLQRIIARCLRKDPERRFQTMADLKAHSRT